MKTRIGFSIFAALVSINANAFAGDPPPIHRVYPPNVHPNDVRLGTPRNLRDAYHPWTPPTTRAAWDKVSTAIRERMLVSNGLWPMPPKRRLQPVIHGLIDKGDYTIEKVYFASHPGHFVTGSLYRPKNIKGKIPGILSPHGHWANGRFYDAGGRKAIEQKAKDAEKFDSGAQYPLQARMVQLARMGCTVFHYDMVGYADSRQIGHRSGFHDVESALRLQNFMGLQTYNSIRALDFLLSLPEIDAKRIGVTGASGGGTQTFMLFAIDPRPSVAFPAVMVSTGMQGGCICENAAYLRTGINNIAIAALCAPRPMALSGADDWTIDIETKGLPELKQVYSLFGKASLVQAICNPQFKHNYNQVSREMMYAWFNQHLGLGHESAIAEREFEPVRPNELSVFNDEYPLPKEATTANELREYLSTVNRQQMSKLMPTKPEQLSEYRRIVGAAARVMFDSPMPEAGSIEVRMLSDTETDYGTVTKAALSRKGSQESVPYVVIRPPKFNGTVAVWIHDAGKSHLFNSKGQPSGDVGRILGAGIAVASVDVFLTGEFPSESLLQVNEGYQGYSFGYNRPTLSNRVRDIVTLIGYLKNQRDVKRIHLAGTGKAGRWALMARSVAGKAVDRTIVDLQGFGFSSVHNSGHPMFLPGSLKYGGVGGLAGLIAPARLTIGGTRGVLESELKPLIDTYQAADGDLHVRSESITNRHVVTELTR